MGLARLQESLDRGLDQVTLTLLQSQAQGQSVVAGDQTLTPTSQLVAKNKIKKKRRLFYLSYFSLETLPVSIKKMVFYFTSNVVEPSAYVYVGKDKFESEWTP